MPPEKDKESGLSPEISRLSAVLARDPSSKLFMPLAEEYMKVMMVEEAIMTLEDGLKANPFYMSARVLLGKAYVENNKLEEALVQFEQVVKSIPDNLLAHRMLGSIYKSLGRYPDAIRSYRMISILNPKDEEIKSILAELESGKVTPIKAEVEELKEAVPETRMAEPLQTAEEPTPYIETPVLDMSEPEPQPAMEPEIFDMPEFMEEPVEAPVFEEEPEPVPEEAGLEMPVLDLDMDIIDTAEVEPEPKLAAPHADTLSWEGEMSPSPVKEEHHVAGSGYAVDFKAAGGLEDIFAAYGGGQESDSTPSGKTGVYEISEEISSFDVDVFKPEQQEEPGLVSETRSDESALEPFETETLAELYIAQGFYDRAIGIYKNLLVEDPGNNQIRQKLEDLYLLAGISSSKAAEDAEKEIAAMPEPAPFTGFDEEPGGLWELPAEEAHVEQMEQVADILSYTSAEHKDFTGYAEERPVVEPEAIRTSLQIDNAAVARLEQFLTNIRKKAGR